MVPARGAGDGVQKIDDLALRHEVRIVEALAEVAAKRADISEVFVIVDAHGDDVFSKLMGDRQDRLKHHCAGALLVAQRDERAVDLDGVDAEPVPIGQG